MYTSSRWELPPRARRIPEKQNDLLQNLRTTSACAENTQRRMADASDVGNYLRVRGEYWVSTRSGLPDRELPPRARRIPLLDIPRQKWYGTTSACAENTPGCCHILASRGNYLRVRGEYLTIRYAPPKNQELPPRARRILLHRARLSRLMGTTSACAENTHRLS